MKDQKYQNDLFGAHFKPKLRQQLRQMSIWATQQKTSIPNLKNNIQFLYGHHLFSDEIRGLYKLTEFFKNNFEIISYSEAIKKIQTGNIDNRYICFSFDDGIKNTQRIAEHFYEQGISAMFFLNPQVVKNANNKEWCAEHSQKKLNKKPLEFFDWKDVEWLQSSNHEIGNHTLSHANLSAINQEELHKEIVEAKNCLESKCGPIHHFSWPYGLRKDINAAAFKLIISSGHTSIASAIRGQHFSPVRLEKEFILRDQIVYHEPLYFFNYFYAKNNQGANKSLTI